MRKRRSVKKLKEAIGRALTKNQKANAYYKLALFHDNNSREREAVPLYQKAIKLGLEREKHARALAWLASSYYKTENYRAALKCMQRSLRMTKSERLKIFLVKLKKRLQANFTEQL